MRAVATLCMLCFAVVSDPQMQASAGGGRGQQSQPQFIAEWTARTAATARRALEGVRTAPSSDLKLEVGPEQSEYAIFSPVTVFVRLSNARAEPVTGNLQLGERHGRLFAYVARSDQSFVPCVSKALVFAQLEDMIAPNLSLPAGGCILVRVSLLYDHVTQDYAFPQPATYRVKVAFVYDTSDYSKVIESNIAEIRVASASGEEAQALSLFEGREQAQVLQRESADPDALAKLRAVVETCPDSEYALYARAAVSQSRAGVGGIDLPAADRPLGPRHQAILQRAIATLCDTSQTVYGRMGAALRLGEQLGHRDAVAALLSAINDGASPLEVRLSAVVALSQIPDKLAVERLLDVAEQNPEPRVRDRARLQLNHMGVPNASAWRGLVKDVWVPRAAGNTTVILDESHK